MDELAMVVLLVFSVLSDNFVWFPRHRLSGRGRCQKNEWYAKSLPLNDCRNPVLVKMNRLEDGLEHLLQRSPSNFKSVAIETEIILRGIQSI
jgi:hypothetical protein